MVPVTSRPPLPPGPFLLVGLARSGRAAGLILRALGERVPACDGGAVAPEARAELEAAGIAVHERSDGVALLDGVRPWSRAPGVPQEAPVIRDGARPRHRRHRRARARLAAAAQRRDRDHRLERQDDDDRARRRDAPRGRLPVAAPGNVGTALTTLAGSLDPAAVVVCEASSFQLEDTLAFAPDAAVLLNLAPDHLDRHGTFEAYRRPSSRSSPTRPPAPSPCCPTTLAPEIPTAAARRVLLRRRGDADSRRGRRADLARRAGRARSTRSGCAAPTTCENAMAASAACLARGMDPERSPRRCATFAGVEHRLEEVGRFGGVLYVDDSKATNVASAVVGIRSFAARRPRDPRRPRQGRGLRAARRARRRALPRRLPRGGGGRAHRRRARRRRARCTTAATSSTPSPPPARAARPGEVILLSPACASYDQYRSFGERGEHFKALAAPAAMSARRREASPERSPSNRV